MIDSFETNKWTHKCKVFPVSGAPYEQEFGNVFTPEGYTFWFRHGKPVAHDPTNADGWSQPEARYSSGYPNRIFDGNQSFMYFGFYRIIDAGLFRKFPTAIDSTLKATVQVHAWSSTEDNPLKSTGVTQPESWDEGTPGLTDAQRNFTFWIGIDPLGGDDPFAESVVWGKGKHVYNKFEQISVEVPASAETFTVFVRGKSLWRYKHNDVYVDYLEVTETPKTGGCEPCAPCYGDPRVQYQRTLVLMPPESTEADWIKAVAKYFAKRYTISNSADDGGIGNLKWKKVIPVWLSAASWIKLDEFYADFYPGTQVEHDYWYTPEPPPPPEPPTIVHYSNNFVGLHSTFQKTGWDTYLREAHPTVMKNFAFGDAIAVKKVEPRALSVFRRHISDDGGWLEKPVDQGAKELADVYEAEIMTYCRNVGRTLDDVMAEHKEIVIESLNETIPSFNPDHIIRSVAFDVRFSQEVHSRWGRWFPVGMLTVAVGNPHETEVELLKPAARQAVKENDFLTYHGYWSANKTTNWLLANWKFHSGRWTEWDKVFAEAGLKPRYYSGEMGICRVTDDGWSFVPTEGWKSCGDFPNYIKQLDLFNKAVIDWNLKHGNRFYGGTVFTYGGWGWDNFDFGPGDLALLTAWSKTI